MKKTLSLLLALCMVLALLSVGVFAADPQNEEPTPESAPETAETNTEPPETEPETIETNTETPETAPETIETNPEPPETNAAGEDDAPLENLGPIPESWGTRDESLIFYTSLSVSVNVKLSITIRDSVVANASSWYLHVMEYYDIELDDASGVYEMRFGEGQAGAVTNINGVAWRAVYTDLEPQEIGRWYRVSLHVNYADGSSSYNISPWMNVKNYVVGELMNPGNPDVVRTYCADLLNYCYAGVLLHYPNSNFGLSDEEAAVKEAFETKTGAPVSTENITESPNIGYGFSWKRSVGVHFLYFSTMNMQLDGTVQIQLKDHETGVVRHVLKTSYESTGTYFAFFNQFEAGDVRRWFDVVVLVDGVETGTPMIWSMEPMIRDIQEDISDFFTPPEEFVAMYRAMLTLDDSVVAALQP